jgi:hypothetical protein
MDPCVTACLSELEYVCMCMWVCLGGFYLYLYIVNQIIGCKRRRIILEFQGCWKQMYKSEESFVPFFLHQQCMLHSWYREKKNHSSHMCLVDFIKSLIALFVHVSIPLENDKTYYHFTSAFCINSCGLLDVRRLCEIWIINLIFFFFLINLKIRNNRT